MHLHVYVNEFPKEPTYLLADGWISGYVVSGVDPAGDWIAVPLHRVHHIRRVDD